MKHSKKTLRSVAAQTAAVLTCARAPSASTRFNGVHAAANQRRQPARHLRHGRTRLAGGRDQVPVVDVGEARDGRAQAAGQHRDARAARILQQRLADRVVGASGLRQ